MHLTDMYVTFQYSIIFIIEYNLNFNKTLTKKTFILTMSLFLVYCFNNTTKMYRKNSKIFMAISL